ncbi:MAG: hypothetical protein CMB48_04965 [Euryarchaeota archaeon]|nr:hypothetical protein [Euryarchaeota archaeon]MBL01661.1 hypothetical protein [Chloroflexota bacterium]|tara:strand:- start:9437 stop:10708 length:1272 start_codon:yes stop_codon:yes gene_type:complete
MTINMALIGAGGMGKRHANGYLELKKYFSDLNIVAVCDIHESVAKTVADYIYEKEGKKPRVLTDIDKVLSLKNLDAIDIATSTPMHHEIAINAMENGLHVITEKPIAITIKAANKMKDVAIKTNKVLSVAENYRRDPINRLTKALIDSKKIGEIYFTLDLNLSSSNKSVMHSTVWRSKKFQAGGNVLDAGVHNADMLLYLLGTVETIFAQVSIFEKERILRNMNEVAPVLSKMYSHRKENSQEGDIILQDAIDSAFGVLKFDSGTIGQISFSDASHGYNLGVSTINGSEGSLYRSPSRSGKSPRIIFSNGREIAGDKLFDLIPEFKLDDDTSMIWDGAKKMSSYNLDFHLVDAKILAFQYIDFYRSIIKNKKPEVGYDEGIKALGLAYGLIESGIKGNVIKLKDVISGKEDIYQKEINEKYLI